MKNDTIPNINSKITFREEYDGWGIVFSPDTGEVFGLNPVSALIWKNINGKDTIDNIHNKIKKFFFDLPEDALNQTKKYLEQLSKKKLITL
ncbi:MAG: PqqD family peptide modification chaperone [Candidatus Saganbacteria bacterium]|nr:PqqD family peptide modification chaperone [Candidatus Saganbacteria bacterium]